MVWLFIFVVLVVFALLLFIKMRGSPPSHDREQRLDVLKRTIGQTRYLENVGNLGEKTADQGVHISERFKRFEELLKSKFDPTEITFNRYYAAAEQTYLAMLDNLYATATLLNSMELMQQTADNTAKVNQLLAFNEKAIAEFDRVSLALAEITTRRGEANVSLDAAIEELTMLADRAKKYSVSS